MQVFNNPLFSKSGSSSLSDSLNNSTGSKPSVQEIIGKYDLKKSKNGVSEFESITVQSNEQKPYEMNDLEDFNISKLLVQLGVENDNDMSLTYDEKNNNNNVSNVEVDLFEEMSSLKDQVLGLLHNYKTSLGQKDKGNAQKIRQQIKNDAKVIQNNYDHILDNFNQSVDISVMESTQPNKQNEQKFNSMFNLVEEFLDKFQGRKPTSNLYSTMVQDRMQASGFLDSSQLRSSKYDFANNTDMSENSVNVTNLNDTFYNHIENIDQKIADIRQILWDLLKDQQYSKTIIMETIDSMQDVIKSQEPTYIRKMMKKIEVQLESIKNEQGNTPSTTKLYSLMQQSLSYMQEKSDEVMNNSMSVHSQPPVVVDPQALRRCFFDEALKVKSELAPDHPGKKLLVSFLFDQAQLAGIAQSQWSAWIKTQVDLKGS